MSMHLRGSKDMMGQPEEHSPKSFGKLRHITDCETRSDTSSVDYTHRSWWQSRTGLEQKLIILCSLLFILSFALVISVIVIKKQKSDSGATTTIAPTTPGSTASGEEPSSTPTGEPTASTTPPTGDPSASTTPPTGDPSASTVTSPPTGVSSSSSKKPSEEPIPQDPDTNKKEENGEAPKYPQSSTDEDVEDANSMHGLAKLSERFQLYAGA